MGSTPHGVTPAEERRVRKAAGGERRLPLGVKPRVLWRFCEWHKHVLVPLVLSPLLGPLQLGRGATAQFYGRGKRGH